MLLDQTALCRQADIAESMELKEMKFHPAIMSKLEKLLFDVYVSLLPSSSEYEQRKQLVQAYNMTVKTIFGNIGGFPSVEAFGSFTMNIFTAKSDLDLSINFSNSKVNSLPRDQAISVLRRFAKVLRRKQSKGHLSGVLPILSAKVPVLKAVDCKTGIECDISVENKDGISRSFFFSIISSIDERFRVISFLMKAWAKANDINSSKDHTMNSLSIISLVALHFQTRDPPILPPFSTLLRDGTNFTNLHQLVPEFMNLATRNKESVAELFVSLLAKLTSVETLWELGLCASNFEGSWISKTWTSKYSSNMNVEDFMDRSQNFARSVGKSEMTKIYDCLRGSLRYLTSSMQGQIETSALATLLFGSMSLHTQSNQKLPPPSSLEQKRTVNESVQKLPINLSRTLVHTKTTAGTSLKRKEKSTKSALPLASAISPVNQATINIITTLKTRPPMETTESKPSIRTHVTNGALKKPRYDKAAGELPPGYHQNHNYVYYPSPMMHPAIPYHLPPLNGIGHMNTSAHQRPPLHRHVPLHGPRPQHPPMAPESSGMFRSYSNPAHPMISDGRHNPSRFPGHTSNAGYPQVFVPHRSFGSNHP